MNNKPVFTILESPATHQPFKNPETGEGLSQMRWRQHAREKTCGTWPILGCMEYFEPIAANSPRLAGKIKRKKVQASCRRLHFGTAAAVTRDKFSESWRDKFHLGLFYKERSGAGLVALSH